MGLLWTVVALAAQEADQKIPSGGMEGPMLDYTWLFVRVCVALVLVISLGFVFIRFFLPRLKGFHRSSQSAIKILDRNTLEPRKSIYLIQVGGRHYLIGTADQSVSLIGELSKDEVEKAYP